MKIKWNIVKKRVNLGVYYFKICFKINIKIKISGGKMQLQIKGFKWPPFTILDLIILIFFVLLFVLIFYIIHLIYKKRLQKETSWLHVLNFALKNDLSFDEILILKSFFNFLSSKKNLNLIYEKQKFYRTLFIYLEKQKNLSSEIKVKLLDKLFEENNKEVQSRIKSLKDIYLGEICNINFLNEHHLGRVLAIDIEKKEILIRIPRFNTEYIEKGINASLYIYRQNIGGFTISGNIKKFGDEYIEFNHDGSEIIMNREYYLMTDKKIIFELIPWPRIKENEIEELKKTYPLYSPPGNNNKVTIEKPDVNIVNGITEKISERAIGFYFKDKNDIDNYKIAPKNIWEINLQLPDNFLFTCRGRIIAPHLIHIARDPDLYFFRYIDLTEEMHNKLFNYIKENNPKRELLY